MAYIMGNSLHYQRYNTLKILEFIDAEANAIVSLIFLSNCFQAILKAEIKQNTLYFKFSEFSKFVF